MIQGTSAGTVTLTVTANDSRALSVSRELTVVGETGTYAVTGGNLYYNTVTGAITDSDDAVTVANIPGIINGTRITAMHLEMSEGNTLALSANLEGMSQTGGLTWSSSNEDVAVVEPSGVIIGVSKGTAVITAALVGDPLGRRAEVKVTVIAPQTEGLVLRPAGDFRELVMLDTDGNPTEEYTAAEKYVVYLNEADVRRGIGTTFIVWPDARDILGNDMEPTASGYKWASSNTKIAAVKTNADGGATVTVKKTASGACVITAVTTDLRQL